MKKLTLALAFSFMFLSGVAQQVEMSYKDVKGLDNARSSGAYFLARHGGLTVVATDRGYNVKYDFGGGAVLLGLNDEGKAEKTLVVSKQKGSMLVAASAVGDTAYLVVSGALKNAPGALHVMKANLATWTLCGEPAPLYERKDKATNNVDWKVATSPNGNAFAISVKEYSNSSRIAKAFGKEDAEYDALIVTDNRFATLWRRDDLAGWYNTFTIDNDEAVHALLVAQSDKSTYFLFANHTSMNDETFVDSVGRTDVASCCLLNYVDGCFVAAGAIGEKRRGLQNLQYSAIFGLSYNTRTNRMTFNAQPLTETEFAVMENVDIDLRRSNATEMQGLSTKEGVATPFGGVLQLWSYMTTVVYSRAGADYIYDLHGSLMAAVDTGGNFVWRVPIRTHVRSANDQSIIRQHITYHNGRTYVVQAENSKIPATYDISRHVSKIALMTGADATLAVYAIDDKGEVSKYTLPQEKLMFLNGRLQKIGDDWYVTMSKLKKTRIVRLKF